MSALATLLNHPEYLHVTVNHLPLIGLPVAMLALAAGLLSKSRAATVIGLALVALLSLSAWPVYYFGDEGYDRVLSMADEVGSVFLKHHKELAERWEFLYYVTAAVAGLGFVSAWKWPKVMRWSSLLALLLAAASLAAGIAIARPGGEIRHREFRFGAPPPTTQASGYPDKRILISWSEASRTHMRPLSTRRPMRAISAK